MFKVFAMDVISEVAKKCEEKSVKESKKASLMEEAAQDLTDIMTELSREHQDPYQ